MQDDDAEVNEALVAIDREFGAGSTEAELGRAFVTGEIEAHEQIHERLTRFLENAAQAKCEYIVTLTCRFGGLNSPIQPPLEPLTFEPGSAVAARQGPVGWGGGGCITIGRCTLCVYRSCKI
jgi:hypothetical protein